MENLSLNELCTKMHEEIKCLHKDVEYLKRTLVPVEEVSDSERGRLDATAAEMDAGKKHSSEDVFG